MNQICLEKCNLNRRCAHFEIRPDLNFDDLPAFDIKRFTNYMSPHERKIEIAVYVALLVDQQKGIYHAPNIRPLRRNTNRSDGSQIFKAIPIESLLPLLLKEDSPLPNQEEHKDPETRPSKVD